MQQFEMLRLQLISKCFDEKLLMQAGKKLTVKDRRQLKQAQAWNEYIPRIPNACHFALEL